MAQPGQYTYEETLPSLFDEDGVTFSISKNEGRNESYEGFTGSDFTVEVFDPWSGDYRSNHPEQPYMLRFDRRRR